MTFNVSIPDKNDPRWTQRDGIFVRRGEGITKWLIGDTTTVKISAAQTDGGLGVSETSVPPGGGAVAHSHGREDEAFYILTGDFEFINGEKPSPPTPATSSGFPAEIDMDSRTWGRFPPLSSRSFSQAATSSSGSTTG